MTTQVLGPVVGLLFMICGLSATMSSGDSDAISGVTILLTDVYPSVTGKTIPEKDYAKYSRIALVTTLVVAFLITLLINDVMSDQPDSFRQRLFLALADLNTEQWRAAEAFARKLAGLPPDPPEK